MAEFSLKEALAKKIGDLNPAASPEQMGKSVVNEVLSQFNPFIQDQIQNIEAKIEESKEAVNACILSAKGDVSRVGATAVSEIKNEWKTTSTKISDEVSGQISKFRAEAEFQKLGIAAAATKYEKIINEAAGEVHNEIKIVNDGVHDSISKLSGLIGECETQLRVATKEIAEVKEKAITRIEAMYDPKKLVVAILKGVWLVVRAWFVKKGVK